MRHRTKWRLLAVVVETLAVALTGVAINIVTDGVTPVAVVLFVVALVLQFVIIVILRGR